MGWTARAFPESRLFSDDDSRRRALRRAQRVALRRPAMWAITGAVACVGLTIGALATLSPFSWAFHLPLHMLGQLIASGSPLVGIWFFRGTVRRSLRTQLREQGHLLCINCGYDLRGTRSKRCPECAAPINKLD